MSNISKQKALEAYPIKEEWVGNQYGGLEDINSLSREKYQEGYDQAIKDMDKDSDHLKYLSDEVGYAYACGCRKTMQNFLDKTEDFLYLQLNNGSIEYCFQRDLTI